MAPEIAPGYEIVREIGRGGMGAVYAARAKNGRRVAIKVLVKPDAPGILERFDRERRLLDEFTFQDGFVPLIDAGKGPLGPYLVMPFMPGGTLRARLDRGPLPIDEVLALGRALARALAHAHGKGIVHRDMKPENVLYDEKGEPFVTDLGLAKHFLPDAPGATGTVRLSRTGELRGTAGYMPPEQMADARSAGPEADVFALGAILYEALTGKPAFKGETVIELLDKVGRGIFDPVKGLRPDAPRGLAAAIERAIALDPVERFADGAALLRALEARKPRRMRNAILVGVVAALAVLVPILLSRKSAPSTVTEKEPALPLGLRRAGRDVAAADSKTVPLYLYTLPDGKDMEMVSVAKGDFIAGSDDRDASRWSKPRRTESIDHAYWIGRTDVTWMQYRAFCRATHRTEPEKPWFWDRIEGPTDQHPVLDVSWDDAKAYCVWAHLDLPTSAEWERAARGTDGRRYPWGNEWDPGRRCNYADRTCPMDGFEIEGLKASEWIRECPDDQWDREHGDGFAFTSPVGSFPAGVSPVGALDMEGNCYQWCDDRTANKRDPDRSGIGEDVRIIRGSGWADPERRCRCAYYYFVVREAINWGLGFRVALRGESPTPPVASAKPALPPGLRVAGRDVAAADSKTVPLYLYALPDGKDMEMVSVAAGDFIMGAEGEGTVPWERPRHTHTIERPYWIGRNDVTWAQYLAFCRATHRTPPDRPWFWGHIETTKDAHPVVEVTWEDAKEYCRWARLALPTAAEWERAARGTDGRSYPWGNDFDPGTRCNFADVTCPMADFEVTGVTASEWIKEMPGDLWDTNPEHSDGYPFSSPVGTYPAGVSPVGALDMAGNVYQWCEDKHAENHDLARAGIFAGDLHVFYGGSWIDPARRCRSSYHYFYAPTVHNFGVGFRVVLR